MYNKAKLKGKYRKPGVGLPVDEIPFMNVGLPTPQRYTGITTFAPGLWPTRIPRHYQEVSHPRPL